MIEPSSYVCWDRFEYVACVCYTGYKDRYETIVRELSRVGLLDRTNFFWDFPSPCTGWMAQRSSHSRYHQRMFPVGYNNYRAIKTCYELGYNSILVLEDDIRFLKDLKCIEQSIRSIPKDYEIVMLDKNFPTDMGKNYIQHNEPATEFTGIKWCLFSKFHSSGCYSLSRIGMVKFIERYEKDFGRGCLKNNDQYFNTQVFDGRKIYAAFPNLAIQCLCGESGCLSPLEEYWTLNEYQGGFMTMYNTDAVNITEQNFLERLYETVDRSANKSVEAMLKGEAPIFCALPPELSKGIKCTADIARFDDQPDNRRYGAALVWGNSRIEPNIKALRVAIRDKCPLVLCEDGFIRSGTTWVDKKAASVRRVAHSLIMDSSAYYFDAYRVSTIEKMLNNPDLKVSAEQCAEARRLITRIVSEKISKYNHQPIFTPSVGRTGVRKVLVVDQSYGDFSISRGLANDETFKKMLWAAITENPDADILVKTHPDTLAGKKGKKKGYFQDIVERENVYKITFPINPYSLMEICDKVYVCTSGMGLEALLAGKEVHTFGMPFYAGWGLTIDAQRLVRRTNKRSLEELFYIFYCVYTHWVDPDKGKETTIDAVIDKMISMRDNKVLALDTAPKNEYRFIRTGNTFRKDRHRRLA